MTNENPLHSGSRWEPAPVPTPGQPAAAGAAPGARPGPRAAGRGARSSGARRRGAFAGAMVGLLAASGLGGLALGHAVADGNDTQTGQVSQLQTSDDRPALPGGSTLPQGTLPAPPPSGDLEGDDGPGGFGDDQGGGSGTTQPGSPT